MKIPIVAVCGATASGKTALGIYIAQKFNGEVISCDSMQIYKGLDIGTAKPNTAEMCGVVHHMIDVVNPEENFSVGEFCSAVHKLIEDISSRNKLPVLVGGTGLYIDNTVYNTSFVAPKRDENITRELMEIYEKEGAAALFEILKKEDPEQAAKLHENDAKRVCRAIEIVRACGKTRAELDDESKCNDSPYDCLWLAIDMDRNILYDRINQRVDEMIKDGLIEETIREVFPKRKILVTAIKANQYIPVIIFSDTTSHYVGYAVRYFSACRRNISAYLPFCAISSSWLPDSISFPSANIRILSAIRVVDSLWEINTTVLSFAYSSMVWFSSYSAAGSSADDGSSIMIRS